MADGVFSFKEVKFLPEAVPEFLKSEDVEDWLMDIGAAIVRDVSTADKNGEYEHELWKERKTRAVVNVKSVGKDAMWREASTGILAKKGKKRR